MFTSPLGRLLPSFRNPVSLVPPRSAITSTQLERGLEQSRAACPAEPGCSPWPLLSKRLCRARAGRALGCPVPSRRCPRCPRCPRRGCTQRQTGACPWGGGTHQGKGFGLNVSDPAGDLGVEGNPCNLVMKTRLPGAGEAEPCCAGEQTPGQVTGPDSGLASTRLRAASPQERGWKTVRGCLLLGMSDRGTSGWGWDTPGQCGDPAAGAGVGRGVPACPSPVAGSGLPCSRARCHHRPGRSGHGGPRAARRRQLVSR